MSTAATVKTSNLEDVQTSTIRSAWGLAVRGLRNIRRLPSTFMPALLMPVFTTIAFSGTFSAITKLPGFPTDRSVNWFMPLGICFGSAFSGVGLGFTAIRDIETGFYDRLRMSPTSRWSLILGPLFTAWMRALMICIFVISIGFLLGVHFTFGIMGVITLVTASLGIATICLGWGLGLAYRFRDMRGAAIMQLSMFTALYLTPAQVPMPLTTGWLNAVARINPVSNILRLARQGLVSKGSSDSLSWANTWGGLVAIAGMSILALIFAKRGLAKLDK
ncbi:MAG: ABC transporter permease [Actinomycetota bacterium]